MPIDNLCQTLVLGIGMYSMYSVHMVIFLRALELIQRSTLTDSVLAIDKVENFVCLMRELPPKKRYLCSYDVGLLLAKHFCEASEEVTATLFFFTFRDIPTVDVRKFSINAFCE